MSEADIVERLTECLSRQLHPEVSIIIRGAIMEMKILRSKNRTSLANNLCPDHRDKQAGKPCLACEIETLSRRLERTSEACDVFEKNSANAAELFESNLKLNREITSLRTELAATPQWRDKPTIPGVYFSSIRGVETLKQWDIDDWPNRYIKVRIFGPIPTDTKETGE